MSLTLWTSFYFSMVIFLNQDQHHTFITKLTKSDDDKSWEEDWLVSGWKVKNGKSERNSWDSYVHFDGLETCCTNHLVLRWLHFVDRILQPLGSWKSGEEPNMVIVEEPGSGWLQLQLLTWRDWRQCSCMVEMCCTNFSSFHCRLEGQKLQGLTKPSAVVFLACDTSLFDSGTRPRTGRKNRTSSGENKEWVTFSAAL